jgi:SAM-dependent methyltransferase
MDLRESPTKQFRRHPWETVRARLFCELLNSCDVIASNSRVLDVGSGDGFFARLLAAVLPPMASIVCFDVNYTDAHLTRLRAGTTLNIDFTRENPSGRFDILVLLDVLEHVPSDVQFLSQLVTDYLGNLGAVLLAVPAWPALYTDHDVALGHYRRYRPSSLRRIAESVGLRVVRGGGLFPSLLVVRAIEKLNELRQGIRSRPNPKRFDATVHTGVGGWAGGPLMTAVLEAFLVPDGRVSLAMARCSLCLPGLSAWALCRRA